MDSETIGVERRRLPFTIVENIVLEDQALGPVDVLVYIALAKHADAEGVCWPSMATIARLARVGRSKAFEAIKHLEALGYLKRTPRFRPDGGVTSNAYRLLEMKVEGPLQDEKVPSQNEKAIPVQHVDGPSPADGRPPVHPADANYTHSEPDPRKGGAPLPASHPEDLVIEELRDVPGLVHDRRFREGCRRLLSEGKTPAELARAVRAAAGDPSERGGLSFILDRYERWQRKAKEEERRPPQNAGLTSAECGRREREAIEERARILAEQESPEGRQLVAAAVARLPWRHIGLSST